MAAELGKAYVQIIPSAKGISGKIREELDPEAKSAGQSAGETIGSQIGSFATKAIAALGIGKMISSAITDGMDFEGSMTKASTLFSGTSAELAELQTQLIDISSATGVAASQLAEAAYNAESASVPVGNLGGMLEASAKLATAGFTDIDTALSATAKTMNAYGMMSEDTVKTQENLEKVQRILIQTQNKGITTVGELGASLAQVTPTAAAFGVSFEQVGASLAGMTAQGTPTAQATTQLNSLIAELGKNGTTAAGNLEKAAEGTKYAGMSFTEMMNNGADLNEVLDMMQGLADENGLAMVDMFSSIEAGKAAMSITNSDWIGNMEAMATEADVVADAYSTMADTTSHKLEVFKNSLKNLGIEAFGASVGVLQRALEGVQRILDRIKAPLESLGTAFSGLITAIGNIVSEQLGLNNEFSLSETIAETLAIAIETVANVIQFLTDNLDVILPIVEAVVAGFVAFKAALAISSIIQGVTTAMSALSAVLLANPVGLVVAAIAALVAGIVLLWNKSEDFRTFVTGIWDGLKNFASWLGEAFTVAGEAITAAFEGIKESVSNAWEAIKASPAVQTLIEYWSSQFETFKETVAGIWEGIKTAAEGAWNMIKDLIGGIILIICDLVTGDFDKLGEDIKSIWSGISDAGQQIWDGLSQIISSLVDGLVGFVTNAFELLSTTLGTIWNGISSAASTVWEGIKTTVSTVSSAVCTVLQNDWDNMKAAYEAHGGGMKGIAAALWEGLKSAYTFGFNLLNELSGGKLEELWNIFQTKFNEIVSAALQWGSDLVNNFVEGIKGGIEWVQKAAESVAETVRSFLHFSKPDVGPLSDFDEYGPDMIRLLIEGMESGIEEAKTRINNVLNEIKKVFDEWIIQFGISFEAYMAPLLERVNAILEQLTTSITTSTETWTTLITDFITQIQAMCDELATKLLEYFVDEGASLFRQITNSIQTFTTNVQTILQTFFTWCQTEEEKLVQQINQYFTGDGSVFAQIITAAQTFITNMQTALTTFFTWIQSETKKLLTDSDGVLEKTRRFLEDLVKLTNEKLLTGSGCIKETLTTFFKDVHELVNKGLIDGSDSILEINKSFFKKLTELIDKSFHKGNKGIQPSTEDLMEWLNEYLSENLDEIYSIAESHLKKVKKKVNNICQKIEERITETIGQAFDWGAELGQNFADGIWSKVGEVEAAAAALAAAAGDYIHFSEPDKGPLANFHTFMPDMIKMMTSGIMAGIPDVESAMGKLSGTLVPDYGSEKYGGTKTGDITINVYGTESMNARELAMMVMDELNHAVYVQGAA